MQRTHNKLVRDKVPSLIKSRGEHVRTQKLGKRAFEAELRKKFIEEATEAVHAKKEKLAEEFADVLEVMNALASLHGIPKGHIEKARKEKLKKRGGFSKRIFLIDTH